MGRIASEAPIERLADWGIDTVFGLLRCYSSRRRVIGTTNHKAPRMTATRIVCRWMDRRYSRSSS